MTPKSVTLNKNKKSIQLEYPNNTFLLLTSSYLRACSPSAENKDKLRRLNVNKRKEVFNSVMINKIEAVGNYAIRIIFDDGHSTGIFSWEYIHMIGSRLQDS
jgi:DUF971 family protein